MKKNYINSILASALLLSSCSSNGPQNQTTQQAQDSSMTEVPADQEQVVEVPSEKPCNFDLILDIEDFWKKTHPELSSLTKPEAFATFQIADKNKKTDFVFLKCGDTIVNCCKFDNNLDFLFKNAMDKITLYQNAIKNCATFVDYRKKTVNSIELWFTDETNIKYDDGQEISYGVSDGQYEADSDENQFAEAENRLGKGIDKKSLKWTEIKF